MLALARGAVGSPAAWVATTLKATPLLLTGLAEDGGLYVPTSLPSFSEAELTAMAAMDYAELALCIIKPFVSESIPEQDLQQIINECYQEFRHEAERTLRRLPWMAGQFGIEYRKGDKLGEEQWAQLAKNIACVQVTLDRSGS